LALTLLEKKSDSAVDQDTLLHGESLFVVSTSDLENVALELFSENFTIDFLALSSVVEGATTHHEKWMRQPLIFLRVEEQPSA